ncbi:MAG: hypothetical protein ABSD21_03515 [Rhizomicrobium sp.]|jgi:hypothetical protein
MTPQSSSPRIACPSGLFDGCEKEIGRLTEAINHASAPEEKGRLARELLENVATLLDCNAYDRDDFNCRLCRELSTLRHKTAAVIDKATALGRHPGTGAEK